MKSMVGQSVVSSRVAPMLPVNHATASAGVSSGIHSARPFDLHRYRAIFPDRFAALLRHHFRNSVEVAAFLNVDEKTARNYLDGVTKPTGPTAVYAVATIPGALAFMMGEAA